MPDDRFSRWLDALEERHLADLRLPEVTRALRALSSVYVERRCGIARGAALDSAGKRAAFALFYGPLHYLLVDSVVRALDAHRPSLDGVIDLGCGTGAAGAAWSSALATGSKRVGNAEPQEAGLGRTDRRTGPRLLGVDRHPWAVEETRWTYRILGLHGTARRDDVVRARIDRKRAAIVLAFTVNELSDESRALLLRRLLRDAGAGAHILIVEPIARSIGQWWHEWAESVRLAGGREDEWRFAVDLPEPVRALDRAAGLDHRVLTARSLYIARQ